MLLIVRPWVSAAAVGRELNAALRIVSPGRRWQLRTRPPLLQWPTLEPLGYRQSGHTGSRLHLHAH